MGWYEAKEKKVITTVRGGEMFGPVLPPFKRKYFASPAPPPPPPKALCEYEFRYLHLGFVCDCPKHLPIVEGQLRIATERNYIAGLTRLSLLAEDFHNKKLKYWPNDSTLAHWVIEHLHGHKRFGGLPRAIGMLDDDNFFQLSS